VLDGITRGLILRLADTLHLPHAEARLTVEDLYGAQECFLTNTTQEVLPVTRVDGHPVAAGVPGEVTTRLQRSFRAWLDRFLDGA
jgi:branched-subunit amino acid aminotransferase/4-amino-4-deoxychorismate lyase